MKKLAQILGADERWLSLGLSAQATPGGREARNAMAAGAINVVAGINQLDGGHPAFPADDDDRAEKEHVHLCAIVQGRQLAIHVAPVEPICGVTHRVVIPAVAGRCQTVVLLIRVEAARIDLIDIYKEMLAKHGTLKGGYYELTVKATESGLEDLEPRLEKSVDPRQKEMTF